MRQFTSLQVAILALGSLCFSSAYAGSTLVQCQMLNCQLLVAKP